MHSLPARLIAASLLLLLVNACGGGGGGGVDNSFLPGVPPEDQIGVIVEDILGERDVLLADEKGSGFVSISKDIAGVGFNPSALHWSNDHRKLMFPARRDALAALELFVADVTRGTVVSANEALLGNGTLGNVLWSPTSDRVVFRVGNTPPRLFTSSIDGSEPLELFTDLPNVLTDAGEFAISPNGTHVAWLVDGLVDGKLELFVDTIQGTGAVRVSADLPANGDVSRVRWAPDSAHLAYLADDTFDETFDLFVTTLGGGPPVRATPGLAAGRNIRVFDFSADSSRVAYDSSQSLLDKFELFTTRADGTGNVRVSPFAAANCHVGSWEWLGTANRLYVVHDSVAPGDYRVFSVNGDGSGIALDLSGPIADPASLGVIFLSPNAQFVAYLAAQVNVAKRELFVADVDVAGSSHQVSAATQGSCTTLVFSWAPDSMHGLYIGDHVTPAIELFTVELGSAPVRHSGLPVETGLRFAADSQAVIAGAESPGSLLSQPVDGLPAADILPGFVGDVVRVAVR
ncbi:MAG: hypothetical protein R3F05_20000 [Planctomycetota bacterium]